MFERLATAILREWDAKYHPLSHPGVNAQSKTVKSPVDGFAFIADATPSHAIAVHHTICAARDLGRKWLYNPDTSKPSKRRDRRARLSPAGDVVKTIKLVEQARQRTPDLRVTLVLTTNQEPGQKLLSELEIVASAGGIVIDLWPRSRLAHFLDHNATGQFLRREFLGTVPTQLSKQLLAELSLQSLTENRPQDDPAAWIGRKLDRTIEEVAHQKVVLLVGESGGGKTVACYKRLAANASSGGFSLLLTDEIIGASPTIVQAVEKALLQLCPSLELGCGAVALRLTEPSRRLMLAVEDINRAPMLLERISRWSKEGSPASWQLLCPVWPENISAQREDIQKQIGEHAILGYPFSADEGTSAVFHRRLLQKRQVTQLEAADISTALGHDPLLIALHEPGTVNGTTDVIGTFLESRLRRLAAKYREISASEYRRAIQALGKAMLLRRVLEPGWHDVLCWPSLGPHIAALRHIVLDQRDLIRLSGSSLQERISFRHDRVRDWILADAAAEMLSVNDLPDDIAAEPYFAEIFGASLMRPNIDVADVVKLANSNVLALFCALRHFREPINPVQREIVSQLSRWIDEQPKDGCNSYLRWESLRTMAGAEGPFIRPLAERLGDNAWDALCARYRNGDTMAGVKLCSKMGLYTRMVGYLELLDHVAERHNDDLTRDLIPLLTASTLDDRWRIGALRLAGHIKSHSLAAAIRTSWDTDVDRAKRIAEYLWAAAQCANGDVDALLEPVCDAWVALPDDARNKVAADVRFGVQDRGLPDDAIRYLLRRAQADRDLNWPITYLLLGVDHPDVLDFFAREQATAYEKKLGSIFGLAITSAWRRRHMSAQSLNRLAAIWQDKSAGDHLRRAAFGLWSLDENADLDLLRCQTDDEVLGDALLSERLRRGDRTAAPTLLLKIADDAHASWWLSAKFVWSDELTKALDRTFERLPELSTDNPHLRAEYDWILADLIMHIPISTAEHLLVKYWPILRSSPSFIIAALYVATPRLTTAAAEALKTAEDPASVLRYITGHFGYKKVGHPGICRPEQIKAIAPYLDILDELDIDHLWTSCNESGWFELRRSLLDAHLKSSSSGFVFLNETRVRRALDRFADEQEISIDYWLERYVKTGAASDDIMMLIENWFKKRNDISALRIVSSAVLYFQERRHVKLLQRAAIEPQDASSRIISDTEYGVKRRTLQ